MSLIQVILNSLKGCLLKLVLTDFEDFVHCQAEAFSNGYNLKCLSW